jgi:predicted RNA-binding protein (virulence factor B family)
MIQLGQINSLKAQKQTEKGVYLVDSQNNEVLLPADSVQVDFSLNSVIDVFVYKNSDEELVATTKTPKLLLNQFAALEAKSKVSFGAFFDMGIDKDLFVPEAEIVEKITPGEFYVVKLYIDEKTNRLAGTTKIKSSLFKDFCDLEVGEKVSAVPFEENEIGINVIVNNSFAGILYKNEVFKPIRVGDNLTAYVKKVRDDNRVDLSLNRFGYRAVDDNVDKLYEVLSATKGELNLTDKSSPEEIYERLGMSKKIFKKAIGALYKQKLLQMSSTGISLIEDNCDGE